MKKAIVYYSLTGQTEKNAKYFAEALGADLIRVDTVKPMPEGKNQQIMYGGMLATFGIKPAITVSPKNLGAYDELILGTPVWAGKMAPAIATLLKDKTVCSKVVAAFLLSGSGNGKKCEAALKQRCAGLQHAVSLVDEYNPISEGNEEKRKAFVKAL